MEKDHTIGYNFVIRTVARDYRMRADTKSQQIAWARAFTILFEIRARVTKMLLNSSIGVYSGVGPFSILMPILYFPKWSIKINFQMQDKQSSAMMRYQI